MNEPLVIVAAVNGGMQMSRDGARVPLTPEDIAEDAHLCRDAGAAIVHVHARDEQGRNTGTPRPSETSFVGYVSAPTS